MEVKGQEKRGCDYIRATQRVLMLMKVYRDYSGGFMNLCITKVHRNK